MQWKDGGSIPLSYQLPDWLAAFELAEQLLRQVGRDSQLADVEQRVPHGAKQTFIADRLTLGLFGMCRRFADYLPRIRSAARKHERTQPGPVISSAILPILGVRPDSML